MHSHAAMRGFLACLTGLFLVLGFAVATPRAQAVTAGAKLEFSTDPGATIRSRTFVKNETAEAATFYPSFEEFTEEEGSRVYTKREGGITSWITPLAPAALGAGVDRWIPLVINVPTDAPPGSHFAVIWWSTADPGKKGEGQVSIAARAGTLIYLTVSGETHRSARIVSFHAEGGRRLFGGLPIRFGVLLRNEGNVYEKPQGTLTLVNLFGGESMKTEVNQYGSQVLPRSQKTLPEIELAGDRFLFGPYRAVLDLTYADGVPLRASLWLLIVPLKATFALAVLLALLALAPFGIKKYNAWILRKAEQPKRRS